MTDTTTPEPKKSRPIGTIIVVAILSAAVTAFVAYMLVSIFAHKQEEKHQYVRVVEVTENTTDPAIWGRNWQRQFDTYSRTVDSTRTKYGGSEAMPEQKLERDPWLKRMFLGYAFSLDYRDRRGHFYMLSDQESTERVKQRPQSGACLHCHASIIPTYRTAGNGDVMKGFEEVCKMKYADAHDLVKKVGSATPDGKTVEGAHPVSCVDCHDPANMNLRVTRPGFIRGIAALAKSDKPVPHLPSIERWRQGSKAKDYDPNTDSTRQEMRSFVCGQCHVEYYCGPKETLFFPWGNGLKVEEIEQLYNNHKFPDGTPFMDYKHAESGAAILKAQHPEFELWSQGIHARSGVACADCHMPYTRVGATKVSDHWVRSPMLNVNHACQVCHHYDEDEIKARVDTIQNRTHDLMQRSAKALMSQLDAIKAARAAGATDEQLADSLKMQRSAQWRLDFVAAENSMGFHADQEVARILGEAIDFARQGEIAAMNFNKPKVPTTQVTQK
jgi:nitrite reductase (cytochrome c-552)